MGRSRFAATTRLCSRALGALLLGVSACHDPTRPRVGVPTLDDAGSDGYLAVTAGAQHTCAIAADSTALCWGSNEFGQLGVAGVTTTCLRDDRDIPCRVRPTPVSGNLKFRRLSAGGVHTCGIAVDERIYCWGDNLRGSLGDPALRASPAPVPIVSAARFLEVTTGAEHTCGVRLDGVAVCWGANEWGQVGNGSSAASVATPANLGGGLLFASISAAGARTCARTADGTGYCWGRTFVTRFGGEDVTRLQGTPARIQATLQFRALSGGAVTTCGISQQNEALCWEGNSTATIGDGSVMGSLTPRPVSGGIEFTSVASALVHSCGLSVSGAVYCWGTGTRGELGNPPALLASTCGANRDPCGTEPVRVSGYRDYAQLSVGQGQHSCALTTAGNVYCWGTGSMGQRGDGRTSAGEWSPVKVMTP